MSDDTAFADELHAVNVRYTCWVVPRNIINTSPTWEGGAYVAEVFKREEVGGERVGGNVYGSILAPCDIFVSFSRFGGEGHSLPEGSRVVGVLRMLPHYKKRRRYVRKGRGAAAEDSKKFLIYIYI